jgi:hypothetical protein
MVVTRKLYTRKHADGPDAHAPWRSGTLRPHNPRVPHRPAQMRPKILLPFTTPTNDNVAGTIEASTTACNSGGIESILGGSEDVASGDNSSIVGGLKETGYATGLMMRSTLARDELRNWAGW